MPSFNTDRLTVGPWAKDCKTPAFETELSTLLTPAVLRHLPPWLAPRPLMSDWIADRNAVQTVLSARHSATNGLIGLAMVWPDKAPATLHIGYMLTETHWDQGYGSELAQGLVRALPSNTLLAGVASENLASARVLDKAGFKHDAARQSPDMLYFRMDQMP